MRHAGRVFGNGRECGDNARMSKPSDMPLADPVPQPPRLSAVLRRREEVAQQVWALVLELPEPIDFAPGQFARVDVAPGQWRDYSIARLDGRDLTLLIDTAFGGVGGEFVASVAQGDPVSLRAPLGEFRLMESPRPKVFIATGTGLAPLLPMLQQLADQRHSLPVQLFFGCATRDRNFLPTYLPALRYLKLHPQLCLTRETPCQPEEFCGRVTRAVAEAELDWPGSDIYAAGNPQMVADIQMLATRHQARHLYTEGY